MIDNLKIQEVLATDQGHRALVTPCLLEFYKEFGTETGRKEPEFHLRVAVGELRQEACHCLDLGHRLWLVWDGLTPIGYITTSIDTSLTYWKHHTACIEELFVTAAYRNQGIGRWLFQQITTLLQKEQEPNPLQFIIGALWRNQDAIRLYERLGFRVYHVTLISPLPGEPVPCPAPSQS